MEEKGWKPMDLKILAGIVIIIAVGIFAIVNEQNKEIQKELSELGLALEQAEFKLEEIKKIPEIHVYPERQDMLFHQYAFYEQFQYDSEGIASPDILNFVLKKELKDTYKEIGLFEDSQKTVVIVPLFTANAYKEPGFYNYYDKTCDEKCLTVTIEDRTSGFTSSDNAVKILRLLQYETITDTDVDKDPKILEEYDKVIVLHNEYVTKNEFEAITNHSKVIYLFPNALYAEVESDYEKNTITLIKGHNYPDEDIRNGFGWEHDNSPMEYDKDCKDWEFYEINNGWMLNCYPENSLLPIDEEFLKKLKDF